MKPAQGSNTNASHNNLSIELFVVLLGGIAAQVRIAFLFYFVTSFVFTDFFFFVYSCHQHRLFQSRLSWNTLLVL